MKPHILVATLFSFLFVSHVFAHGAGTSFESENEHYLVDIGYDTPFSTDADTLLDFALYDMHDGEVEGLAEFDTVQVAFHSGSTVQWSHELSKPDFGKVFTTVTPKKAGNWILDVSFIKDEQLLHEEEFPFSIAQGAATQRESKTISLFVFLAAVFGVVSYLTFFRKK